MTARVAELEVRVYPLVKKFLSYHYDTAPFGVDYLRNPYATYLHAQMDRRDVRDSRELPRKYERLTERLTVSVGGWRGRNYGVSISPHREAAFNDFVKQLFFEKLADEVAIRTSLGEGLKAAIKNFLNRYAITEDDIPLKTVIEYYYRTNRKLARADTSRSQSTPIDEPVERAIRPLPTAAQPAGLTQLAA